MAETSERPTSENVVASDTISDRSLHDKVVLITGGARGMGLCEAELLASRGCHVAIGDLRSSEGEGAAEALRNDGLSVRFVEHDVTSVESWNGITAFLQQWRGRVNVLVNNAGVLPRGSILSESPESFRETLEVNLTGAFLGMQIVGRIMKEQRSGSIINISSTAGLFAIADHASYGASKWGLRGLTKIGAVELGQYGIRVNSIHPGPILTELLGYSETRAEAVGAGLPLGRMGKPIDVAEVVAFLASDRSGFMTGAELAVDGGNVAGPSSRG